MKIEHKILHDLVRASESAGFRVMAETDGLYNYGREPVWLEVHGVAKRDRGEMCLSARKPGRKGFHRVAIGWFTGNVGLESVGEKLPEAQ